VTGYTVLKLTDARSIPLFEGHVGRLGEAARGALRAFAAHAEPGIYRVMWRDEQLQPVKLARSRLVEGMPTRLAVSPFAGHVGAFAKPAAPSPYDTVRMDGVATLLTDLAGAQLYEACSAGLLAWDGTSLVLPPEEVPRVASLAEAAVIAHCAHRRAPLQVADAWPLLLLNAVVGTCAVEVVGRAPFPEGVRAQVDAALRG
jgi:hypothetical protein